MNCVLNKKRNRQFDLSQAKCKRTHPRNTRNEEALDCFKNERKKINLATS